MLSRTVNQPEGRRWTPEADRLVDSMVQHIYSLYASDPRWHHLVSRQVLKSCKLLKDKERRFIRRHSIESISTSMQSDKADEEQWLRAIELASGYPLDLVSTSTQQTEPTSSHLERETSSYFLIRELDNVKKEEHKRHQSSSLTTSREHYRSDLKCRRPTRRTTSQRSVVSRNQSTSPTRSTVGPSPRTNTSISGGQLSETSSSITHSPHQPNQKIANSQQTPPFPLAKPTKQPHFPPTPIQALNHP